MPKIVILGSCRHEPYEILAVPESHPTLHNTKEGYEWACKKFYPAIREADVVLVYSPDGRIGEHTRLDMDYAETRGKVLQVIR